MNSDLEKLIALEKIDREFVRLTEEVAALPKHVAEIEHKLADHKAAVEKAKAAIKNNEASRRQLEADIQGFQQKIIKYREQSAKVKNNDEYRALMHEVEFAEKEIRTCEDKILELMSGLESAEKNLKAAEAELKTEGAAVEKEKDEARARTAEDEKLLKSLGEQRAALRNGVADSTMAHYDRLMRQRKSAIAEARDQRCQSCFVLMRPQVWQEVATNEQIIMCSSCARILFYDPSHQPPPAPPEPPKKTRKKKAAPAKAAEDGIATETADAATDENKESETTPTQ